VNAAKRKPGLSQTQAPCEQKISNVSAAAEATPQGIGANSAWRDRPHARHAANRALLLADQLLLANQPLAPAVLNIRCLGRDRRAQAGQTAQLKRGAYGRLDGASGLVCTRSPTLASRI
jgi:hypothetical protein